MYACILKVMVGGHCFGYKFLILYKKKKRERLGEKWGVCTEGCVDAAKYTPREKDSAEG